MIIFSIGLPSSFAKWCDAVTMRLAQYALGSAESIAANTLEELAVGMLNARSPNIVVSASQPGTRLRQALLNSRARILLALGDPHAAIADMTAAEGCEPSVAVRSVSSSCAAMLRFLDLPGVLRLTDIGDWPQAEATAGAIGRHLGFSVPASDITAIVGGLRPSLRDARNVDAWWENLDKDKRALVSGALDTYAEYAKTGNFGQITWERALFLVGDRPNEPATRAIDITGRARCLFYGPYIMLPPGSWTAHVVLVCSKEVGGMGFIVEIVAGATQLARTRLQMERGGVFETSIDFVIEDVTDGTIEVRVFNERAAFDGRLGLGRVLLLPRKNPRPDNFGDVAAELGLEVA